MRKIFATCPKGLEEILVKELTSLGAKKTSLTVAGVFAEGDIIFIYKSCLWSRIANRILLPLAKFQVTSDSDLYNGIKNISWETHFTPRESIAVNFSGSNDVIRHTQFGAQRVKDGIVDKLNEHYNDRSDVDLKNPDIRINVRLSKDQANVSFDMSGDSLHKRGYRKAMVAATLKENLAAALLFRADWPNLSTKGNALIDPMCGSGTLLIEAALIAADIAPNLNREKFGFHRWLQHDCDLWCQIRNDALDRCAVGLAKELPEIRGYDKDSKAIVAAQENIISAGLDKHIRVISKPLVAFKLPTHKKIQCGLVICNPPYGERWGDVEGLKPLYRDLGEILKSECPGWKFALITGNSDLSGELKLRAEKKYQIFNGAIPSQLILYQLNNLTDRVTSSFQKKIISEKRQISEGASMLFNRLKKNTRKLNGWIKQSNINSYRLYDSDIPEYAVVIDIYGDSVHIQEYAPPLYIDSNQSKKHLEEVREAVTSFFDKQHSRLIFKERRRQKGSSQYHPKNDKNSKDYTFNLTENSYTFEINMGAYLDTGLFLDHRPVRRLIHGLSQNKRFLNLFCYTASATIYAIKGGAKSSLSIDMSKTYVDWAKRNFSLNSICTKSNKVIREDCLVWLDKNVKNKDKLGQYDLVFLDPPTFSNSKRMDSTFDVQRDHIELIKKSMLLLDQNGSLVFTNNFRNFSMSSDIIERYQVCNISDKTFDPDFQRNKKIHNCWIIEHAK
jgi:23S rRNA (guanine2445-N2)-methyltransferase / 23S rRNA (guanine2069-N7)-methyltransferase